MTIRVSEFEDSAAFLDQAGQFLAEDEVVNGLVLGAVLALSRQTLSRRRHRPRFALVEDDRGPAAAVAWTQPHKLLITTHKPVSDAALDATARRLAIGKAAPPAIFGPAPVARRFAESWAGNVGRPVTAGMAQRLYVLRDVSWPEQTVEGALYPASYFNRELLGRWILSFQLEAIPGDASDREAALMIADRLLLDSHLFVWVAAPSGGNPQPVSMAAKARPTQKGCAVNLVYTPPEFRRRGYASASVAQLSQQLLDEGWEFCTLFTDQANPTSNHIYEMIGYRPVLDFAEYRLGGGTGQR